jgi:hypothetical protein
VAYVGPSPDGTEPLKWFKYDNAAFDRLTPEALLRLGSELVPLVDVIAPTVTATFTPKSTEILNGTPVTRHTTTIKGASVVAELGNSLLGALAVTPKVIGQLTTESPAVVDIDSTGRVVRIQVDLKDLYLELVRINGSSAAAEGARLTSATSVEIVLTDLGTSQLIALPDPAKVETA